MQNQGSERDQETEKYLVEFPWHLSVVEQIVPEKGQRTYQQGFERILMTEEYDLLSQSLVGKASQDSNRGWGRRSLDKNQKGQTQPAQSLPSELVGAPTLEPPEEAALLSLGVGKGDDGAEERVLCIVLFLILEETLAPLDRVAKSAKTTLVRVGEA